MVEPSAQRPPAAADKGQVGIIVGNPTATRGQRLPICEADGYQVYATKYCVIFRHVADPHTKSLCFSISQKDCTAVAKAPAHNHWAAGFDNGQVLMLEINEAGTDVY